jgi:predicted porin
MKKSLFALAAVTAFAGAAQAQSSVTVYGILDVGFTGSQVRAPASAASTATVNTGTTAFSGTGSQSTSRLGFRGREDLGGGTAAFFTAEFALAPTDATLSGNGNGGLANRQTFVGLSQKGVGQAAIGTQNTPIHNAVGRTDPGQQNNISGNVIYTATGGAGETTTTNAYTVRVNNALTLQTDRMAGFQINALYNNNNSTSSASTQNDNVAYGGGINYVFKGLNFDAAYQNLKNTNFTTGTQTAVAFPTGSSTNTVTTATATAGQGFNFYAPFGTSVTQAQMYFGAVYDFGILKAYAQYIDSKTSSNLNSGNFVQRQAQQLGVRGNFSPKIEAWGSIGNGRLNAAQNQSLAATTQASQNFTGYQVGANYILSKRTNAYAIYGSTQVSSSSVATSEGRNSYGVGVRHTF